MSIEKDFTTEATPSLTCSITVGFSSAWAVVVVVGAGSPANLCLSQRYSLTFRLSILTY